MRRWFVPLTVLGLGSVGVMLLTQRGRSALRALVADVGHAGEKLVEWNDNFQRELDGIQAKLDRVAESLDLHLEMKTSG